MVGIPLLVFLTLPLSALVWRSSPSEIIGQLQTPAVYQAIGLSMKTSLVALGLTVLCGTPLALMLSRISFPFRKAVDTLVDLPMVLPPAVAGVALLMAFGREGVVGGVLEDLGFQIPFTQTAVVLAQTFVAAPLYVRAAVIGLSGIQTELEEAALLDGAGSWHVLRYVTLPLASPALVGGAVLTWARALGEFGATIIFAGNLPGRTQTMPLAIYLGFELDLGVALTLSVLLMGTSFLVLVVVRYALMG